MAESYLKKWKVLFCSSGSLNPSILFFRNVLERIPELDLNIIFPHQTFNPELIDSMDLVFCVRDLPDETLKTLQYAHQQGIKTIFAIDDNLHEYAKVAPKFKEYNSPKVLDTLCQIDLIFCTSQNLCDYYHTLTGRPAILLPANIPAEKLPLQANPMGENINLGYFGNPKGDVFHKIAPALNELREIQPRLTIFSAGVDLNQFGVESVFIKFNRDYNQALVNIRKLCPQILIAPYDVEFSKGVPNTNLEYKCVAKLIDATLLGAVLVASKLGPFKNLGKEQGVITVMNSSDEWKNAILQLINNEQSRSELFTNARQYLIENHETGGVARQTGDILLDFLKNNSRN